jgi:hypothetical protein
MLTLVAQHGPAACPGTHAARGRTRKSCTRWPPWPSLSVSSNTMPFSTRVRAVTTCVRAASALPSIPYPIPACPALSKSGGALAQSAPRVCEGPRLVL